MFKKKVLKIVKIISISFAVAFTACDIGLGGAVDTEAPSGAITSPGVDAVIRGTFGLKGTWQDDGTVSSVKITLKNTNTESVYSYNGTVDASGTWYCEINPADSAQPLLDGSYLATVVIYDEGGHSSTLTRSYAIDNTPPLIVLQRPSTKATAASSDAFGQTFTLKGQAVDDNDVSKILVNVYGDVNCTSLLKTVTLSNVPANMEMEVAKFEEGNTSNDYYQIYKDSSANGTKEFYCTLVAYDGAAYYPLDDSQISSDGNSTTSYYLYNDISTIISTYKSTGIYHILNGNSADTGNVKAALAAKVVTASRFSLNPDNSPTFTVEGTGKLDSGDSMYTTDDEGNATLKTSCKITNGTKELIVTVSPGRDAISIDADDAENPLTVYLKECEEDGTIVSGGDEVTLIKAYLNSDGTAWVISEGTGSVSISDSNYVITTGTISTEVYSSLVIDGKYRVCVKAYDENGLEAVEYNSKKYAFVFSSSGSAIEASASATPEYITSKDVSSESAEIKAIRTATSIELKDTITATLKYTYTDKDLYLYRDFDLATGEKPTTQVECSSGTSEFPKGEDQTWSEDISAANLKKSDGSYASKITYRFTSVDGETDAASNNKYITVKYDNTVPVLKITDDTFPSTTQTALSSFSFTGTATDAGSGVAAVYLSITNNATVDDETELRTTGALKATGTNSWTYSISKSDLPSGKVFDTEGYKTVKIWAVDNVGLISEIYENTTWIYDTSAPDFTISSYVSKIDDDTYEDSGTQITTSSTGTASFNTGKAFKLIGTASDNFGISSIKVVQTCGTDSVTLSSENGGVVYDSEAGTWYINDLPRATSGNEVSLPDSGKLATYTYTFSITDMGGTSATAKNLSVIIDREPPVITVSSPDSKAFGDDSLSGSAYTFRGTATDGSGLGMQSYKYAITDSSTAPTDDDDAWTTVSYESSGNWSFSKSLGQGTTGSESDLINEGTKYIHVVGVDKANNETTPVTVSFCVDQSAPTVSVSMQKKATSDSASYEPLKQANSYIINDAKVFRFLVHASDTNGINSVTATVNNTTAALKEDSNYWYCDDITEEGSYSIVVTVEDKSGNGLSGTDAISGRKTQLTRTVVFDHTPPVIESVTVNGVSVSADADNSSVWYKSLTIPVVVNVTDAASQIDVVEYSVDNSEWNTLTQTSTENQYKANVIFASSGNNKLYLRATDLAGNIIQFKTLQSGEAADGININIDTTTPDLEGLFYKVGSGSLNTAGGTAYVNGQKEITIYGLYKDDESGVNSELSFALGTTISPTVTYSSTLPTYNDSGIATDTWITTAEAAATSDAGAFAAYSEFTDKSKIKSWKAVYTPTTSGKLTVSGKNLAGGQTESNLFTISFDTTAPEVQNISFKTNSQTYKVYQQDTDTYWVNNTSSSSAPQTFTLAGIATDNVGVDTVTLSVGQTSYDMDSSSSVSQWSFSGIDLSSLSSQTSAELTVTDKAGNSTSKTITIKFDTVSPGSLHKFDDNNKDIYFRIGSQDNNDITTTSKNPVWVDAWDKDVGGKYSQGTYGNSTSMKIRGYFSDSDSGLSTIYYKVYSSEPSNSGDTLKTEVLSEYTGTITPLTTNQNRRVFYTGSQGLTNEAPLSGTSKYYATVESTFADTISGFSEGSNYLVLVAVDNVGNSYLDTVQITSDSTTVTKEFASLNVDMTLPQVSSDYSSVTIYSNGTVISGQESITLTGSATDNASGVAKLVLTVTAGGTKNTITASLGTQNSIDTTWSATLPASYFASATGNITVYGVATDAAGNSSSSTSVATICVDKTAPTVAIKTPNDADTSTSGTQVNGTISLSGTISNEQYLTEDTDVEEGTMVLYYTTSSTVGASAPTANTTLEGTDSASSAWIKLETTQHNASWTFSEINTKQLPDSYDGTNYGSTYIADNSTVYFTVAATDKAGNIGYATPVPVIFDQDTDRPVITFSNLTLSGTDDSGNVGSMNSSYKVWASTNSLYGTVTDDDGISAVYVVGTDGTSPSDSTDWGSNIYSNGAWEYTASEGYSVLWFKVVDSEGCTFISSTEPSSATDQALLSTPKLKDKASTVNRYAYKTGSGITATKNVFASTVYVQIDTQNPEIYQTVWCTLDDSVVSALTSATGDNLTAIIDSPSEHDWKPISEISGTYIGGPDSKIYILYKASDTNGVKITTETFGEITGEKIYPSASPTTPYSTNSDYFAQVVSFDMSGITSSNSVNMALTVTDRANRTYTGNYYFAVDNEAPTVEIRNYSDGDSVYGSLGVSVTGRTTENRSSISNLYFAVTKDETAPTDDGVWTDFTDYVNTSSWTIAFDGAENTNSTESTSYHTSTLNTWMDKVYGSGTSSSNDSEYLYIWVYAKDSLGNSSLSDPVKVKLDVLTQGDKPSVSITYPTSGATAGGTIRVTGTTEINVDSVAAVWLQIDPSYDESTGFNTEWATELASLIDGKSVGYKIVTETNPSVAASESTPGSTLGAGILASGSVQSWNLPINAISEFGSKKVTIAIRAYAVSSSNAKLSNPSEVYFTVDPNSPVFGEEQEIILINAADKTKTQKYTSGMWISGLWYLCGSVSHSAGIKTLNKDSTALVSEGSAIDGTIISEGKTASSTSAKNWIFKIPVGSSNSDEVGTTNFTLEAFDNTDNNNTASLTVKINYDNKAPSSFTPTGLTATDNAFKQSNGALTLKGTVVEGGTESGFARNTFFFTRDITVSGTTTRYLIDPMLAKGDSKKANFVTLGTVSGTTFTAASGITYDSTDGLYWRSSTGASNTNELAVSSLPDNVRIGGLCKINGVIYRIKAISGTTLTVEGEFEDASDLTVYFALAQVIDNTTTETGTTDVYDSSSTDTMTSADGDQMVEGITQNGTTYTWSASINSKNIYDGPVTLHFSYFDAAGNCATASYDGMVSNNAPRLAGVTVWCDYNGDGIESADSETQSYWYSSVTRTVSGSSVKRASDVTTSLIASSDNTTSGNAFMTVKDATQIRPEIIGGNGNLYYSYKIGTDVNSPTISGENTTSFATGSDDYDSYFTSDANGLQYVNSHTATIPISYADFTTYLGVSGAKIENSTSDAPTWFQYTIWDETDGTTQFTDSQQATLQIALAVQVHDEENPTAAIKPFFWKSSSDNSLYQNSTSYGHIELEGDLPSGTSEIFNASSGLYDTDPKVSGKIVVRGTAYDNIRLSTLSVKFAGHSELGSKFVQAATYSSGTWTPASTTLDTDGWTFTAEDTTYDSTGHNVSWTLTIDTEFISGVADTDKAIEVMATDERGGLTSETSTTQTTSATNTSFYQVDVVPYITGISTSVRSASGLKDSNIRSASGKYSVLANNSSNAITVSGFNFNTSGIAARIVDSSTYSSNSVETSSGVSLTISASDKNTATITNSSITKSGYLELFSNKIRALNNVNNNAAHDASGSGSSIGSTVTDYANYYNREPDYYTTKNVQLTDDRYLRFFDMTSTGIKNGYYPDMIVNTKNTADGSGNIVFSYLNPTGADSSVVSNYTSNFQPQRLVVTANGTVKSTEYLVGGLAWDQMAMAQDESGRYIHASVYNYNDASMSVFYDKFSSLTMSNYKEGSKTNQNKGTEGTYKGWGSGVLYSGQYVNYAHWTDNNALTVDSISYSSLLLDRYKNIKLVTKGNSTNSSDPARVYMAFYDDNLGKIYFRNFKIAPDSSLGNKMYASSSNSGTTTASDGGIYSQYTNLTENTANSTTYDTGKSTVASSASEHIDMGVTSDNVVVIVYYDMFEGRLRLMYKTDVDGDSPNTALSFTENISITLPDYVGQYVSLAVDDSNGIHIAAFDANDSDLKYIYLASYNATSYTQMTVDAAGSVGNWTSIKIKNEVPYIAYYNATETGGHDAIKLAYANNTIGSITAGIDSSTNYTSTGWEYMTVPSLTPAQGGSTKFRHVNLDFDSSGLPVVGYLGTNLEFGKQLGE